jgi:hypothetical protein
VPAEGLEPTRSCDHWILSPARLPVPPRRREKWSGKIRIHPGVASFTARSTYSGNGAHIVEAFVPSAYFQVGACYKHRYNSRGEPTTIVVPPARAAASFASVRIFHGERSRCVNQRAIEEAPRSLFRFEPRPSPADWESYRLRPALWSRTAARLESVVLELRKRAPACGQIENPISDLCAAEAPTQGAPRFRINSDTRTV